MSSGGRPSCVECYAPISETELFEDDDGHYRKRCNSCGHEWGPFVSEDLGEPESSQMSLVDFE